MNSSRKIPVKRPQRRDLTIEKIVEATLEVLKSSDPSALTMRRVAEQCGVSAMAIYHHVEDKDQLATLAVDSIFLKAAQASRQGADWQERLLDLLAKVRSGLLETPGAGMIFVRQAVIGPGTAITTEQAFRYLKEGGLSGQMAAESMDAMTMLLIGSIANELTRPPNIRERLGEQVPAEETPLLHELLGHYASRDGGERFLIAIRGLLGGVVRRAED